MLEAIGLLVPFYHNIQHFINCNVVLMVDNLGTVWAYEKGRSKEDMYTSVIMFALNLLAIHFSCRLYVQHCPRLSSEAAVIADLLSRTNPQGLAFVQRKQSDIRKGWPPFLLKWMDEPTLVSLW